MVVEMQKENAFFKSYLETQSADFLRIYLSDFINHSMHFFFKTRANFMQRLFPNGCCCLLTVINFNEF